MKIRINDCEMKIRINFMSKQNNLLDFRKINHELLHSIKSKVDNSLK